MATLRFFDIEYIIVRNACFKSVHDCIIREMELGIFMNSNKLHEFVLYLISLYAGVIATDCAQRIMLSLARHGLISWREYLYDSKIILVTATYLAYRHLKNSPYGIDRSSYKNFFHKNLLFFVAIVAATRLVFTQFHSFYAVYISPLKLLFFVW